MNHQIQHFYPYRKSQFASLRPKVADNNFSRKGKISEVSNLEVGTVLTFHFNFLKNRFYRWKKVNLITIEP